MKALLVNPAFPPTFWSLDRVMNMLNKGSTHPPLGLLTVAALLPDDWELKLVDLSFQRISESDWQDCDLVLVTGMMVQHRGLVQTVREAARRGKPAVVGGSYAYHFPEEILRAGADVVVRGEGEITVPRLVDNLRRGRKERIIEADRTADLTESPAPRYDLIDLNRYADMSVQFSRGCPFACEFCDVTLMLGKKVRTKTPEQVLQELETLYRMGWRRAVFFVDDNFLGNPIKT
ncbi:MAG: radical SAM protein, partial [Desulfobacteraceae bacterium]